jgi:DnaK suppressor protein
MALPRRKTRSLALRRILEDTRRRLLGDLHGKMRDVRSQTIDDREVRDALDGLHGDIQQDLDLAMLQMKAEMLHHVDAALRRLAVGRYGDCIDCNKEIPDDRLRALPFAARCVACENAREDGAVRQPAPGRAYGLTDVG